MTTYVRTAFFALAIVASSNALASAAVITFTSEAAFDAATNATVVEDFESFSPKDTNLAVIVSNGITYTPVGTGTNVAVASPGYTNFGAGVNPTTTSILTASGNEDFTGVFSSPAFAVGFDVFLNGLGPATATFFNDATLLGTVAFPTGDDQRFAGILSDVAVTSFRWTATRGGELNTGIDNVALGDAAQVPEPATVLLLGFGLLAAARRWRQPSW